jgi:TolB-like protein/Tfp pilus assembly protein PilF
MPSRFLAFIRALRKRGLFGVLALYIVGAWGVLQVAALVFPGWGVPDYAIRHVWTGAVLLFPIAVAFGWLYEITPQGLRRTTASEDVSLTAPDYGIVIALLAVSIAALYFVTSQVLATRVGVEQSAGLAHAPEHSIAVLPFVNMSGDESNEYFSDGLSEQLLNELARIPELHVAARTSAFYYKGRDQNVEKIGVELGVRNVLEGSVRKVGNRIRITAQLIDTANGYHLWSETYDRTLDDVFGVQDEISREIADMLEVRMLAQEKLRDVELGPRGAEAFDMFLHGLSYAQPGTGDGYERAISSYRRAIDIAHAFVAAHNQLAYSYLMLPFKDRMSFDDSIAAAEPYIARALELAPESADVIATQALSRALARKFDEANPLFERAISLNPNLFVAHMHYGLSLVYQGRLKEASTAYIQAQALDPMNVSLNANLGALFMLMGRPDEGFEFSEKALAIDPAYTPARDRMSLWLSNYGRLADSKQYGLELLEESPESSIILSALTRNYVRLGMNDDAEAMLDRLMNAGVDDFRKGWTADHFYIATNDVEGYAAFAELLFQNVKAKLGDRLSFTDRMRTQWYGRSLLLRGRYGEAVDMFWWSVGGEDGVAGATYDFVFFLKYLAFAYQKTGKLEEAEQLLSRAHELVTTARDNGWGTPFLYVRLAEIEAIRGDVESAVRNIGIAVDKGYRDLPWLRHSPFFRDIQQHWEMERLQQVVRQGIAAERAKLSLGWPARTESRLNVAERTYQERRPYFAHSGHCLFKAILELRHGDIQFRPAGVQRRNFSREKA